METKNTSEPQSDVAQRLLELVRSLVTELHPGRSADSVEFESVLDRDLGIDSLGRVELVMRVERAFDVRLPEHTFATVETAGDLLRAIQNSTPYTIASPTAAVEMARGSASSPRHGRTLVDMLNWHVERHADRPHIRLHQSDRDDQIVTYGDLHARACKSAAALQSLGVEPGDRVAIMLPTCISYFDSFYGVVLAGAIPAPIYPPVRRSQLEDHLARQSTILNNCQPKVLITVDEAKSLAHLLQAQVPVLRRVVTPQELLQIDANYQSPAVREEDIAFLQYTSGSTGNPKGVVLTHRNLLANIRADGEHIKANDQDVFVSWLPLYHDMGLIGAWLGSLYFAIPLVCMSPLTFLSRPQRWLWAIHRYRGSLSAAPNFAYELCLTKIRDKDIEGLNLSSWRVAFNGAEAVSAQTIERFTQRFAPAGFRPQTMYPVYGLAECTVGLAFPPLGRPPVIDRVQRDVLMEQGQAIPADDGDQGAVRIVASGQPLRGHEIRIVDDQHRELPERQVGHLQFRGPSTTSGYYRQAQVTQALFHDGWLGSGDRAYMVGGDVFITGRQKDLIIRAGRNIYPEEIEEALSHIDGVRMGRVAVFGSNDPDSGTERLIVVAETRTTDDAEKQTLHEKIAALTTDLAGTPPDEVVLAPAGTVLKTSSGKLRRSDCRTLYEENAIGKPRPAVSWQLMRLVLRGLKPQMSRLKNIAADYMYAAWCWSSFVVLAGVTWLIWHVLPTHQWRWGFMHNTVRLLAWISGTPLLIDGRENLLTDRPCVYVANHASYLDGYVLIGSLSAPFRFVAKADLRQKPVVYRFLKRIGTLFVERMDAQQAAEDAKQIAIAADDKRAIAFFPEGTFRRMPGLLPFHMGAFVTAVEINAPVIPIAIRGTRYILRGDSWFPRRGRVSVSIGEPIYPDAASDSHDARWMSALTLRDQARQYLLQHTREPDLII
ncbi:MAG: AMP-binding protein [Gammaproteobacteria bacterium]|nr:AMP-binding protein [Gammaproteobacteria bacterium]MDH3466292.1 AMP-binding protein [Gammaproteobacteria bacterium]